MPAANDPRWVLVAETGALSNHAARGPGQGSHPPPRSPSPSLQSVPSRASFAGPVPAAGATRCLAHPADHPQWETLTQQL